uniref:NADH-ubiquinone oxidoreductase chain 2 n=1 Tax=Amphiascoides atopus TaxID=1352461 RepID=W8DNB8_9MAXI|nr:NADH dehydrogenase subunit 2 [Amphiascoides atopus]AHB52770.1 NADH dehydrogenase subunit 2 [Amphiascoides atopus]
MINLMMGNFCMVFWGLSVITGLSVNSGVIMWACMELNLLCFVFLLLVINDDCYSAVKYFLIQALGSILFLLSLMLEMTISYSLFIIILLLAILLKLAMAPFQFWLVNLVKDINWLSFFFISVFQKLLPLYVFMLVLSDVSGAVALIGVMVASWGGMVTSQLKVMLIYSSVLGVAWMISSQSYSLALFFLFAYMVAFYYLGHLLWSMEAQTSGELGTWGLSSISRVGVFLSFLSMAGMPPFLGFFPKIFIIYHAWAYASLFTLLVLLWGSMVFIYVYLRMCLAGMGWSSSTSVMPFNVNSSIVFVLLLSSGSLLALLA